MNSAQPTESFAGLLLRCRGRTRLTQRELAERLNAGRRTVQDWEAGINHPNAERLRDLVEVLLETGGLTAGHEAEEAQQLWLAVEREAPRMRTPLDEVWLARLLADRDATRLVPERGLPPLGEPESGPVERAEDWGGAPDVLGFVGRAEELATLRAWVLDEHCRVLAVLGMGGIGKSILASRLAQDVASGFHYAYWRSLRDAPLTADWLAGAIGFLSGQQMLAPEGESERIRLLLQLLRERPSLLVLDNFETLLQPGDPRGRYREGYAGYGRLLQAIGEGRHQSCLLVTSRESPPECSMLQGGAVRTFHLGGLGVADGQVLLAGRGLSGSTLEWASLVDRFGGNGLALKVVGESIRELFGGELRAFLDEVGSDTVFGGIRRLLAEQLDRSSSVEQKMLRVLAVEREPVDIAQLIAELGSRLRPGDVLEAAEASLRRSLVERSEAAGPAAFTLQSVVLEYMTDRLVEEVVEEITLGRPVLLMDQPLIKAQVKDYVRQTQERLIGEPVLQRLGAELGAEHAEQLLLALLDGWRDRAHSEHGYGPGNVVNMLRLLRGDLRGLDLSGLVIRHAYLPDVEAQDASLAGSDLADVVLAEAFDHPIAVALSRDGAYLIAGTPAGEVLQWRVGDRTPLMAVQAHTGGVWDVAVSGDGQLLATGSVNGEIGVWEAGRGGPLARFQGQSGAVWALAMSSDGRLLASGGLDGTVKLWEAASGQLLDVLTGHEGGVVCLSLSGDGRLVASGSEDGTVRLWDSVERQPLAVLRGHRGGVWGLSVSGDGRLVASSSYDETVKLWDPPTGQLLATLRGHAGAVRGVALSGDGRLVASGGFDTTIRLWDSTRCEALAILQGHSGGVMSVTLSDDARLLASGSLDGTVKLWDTQSKQLLADLRGHSGRVRGMAMSADGQLLAAGSFDGRVRLWHTGTAKLIATLQVGRAGGVMSVGLSADGHLVVTGSFDGTASIWDSRTGRLLASSRGHTGGIRGVALSRDGGLLATGSFDATVRLCATDTGELLATLQGHTGPVWGIALSDDGRMLASGSFDGTIRLWNTESRRALATLEGHTSGVVGVALSADGRLLASGSQDGTVRLWETSSSRPLQTLRGHGGGVWSVALSGDGRLLASASFDGTIRLWSLADIWGGNETMLGMQTQPSGRLLATLQGDNHAGAEHAGGGIRGMALSDDGRLVVSASEDGTLVLWDTSTGARIRSLRIDRPYERLDITDLTGITQAQRAALLALGATERAHAHDETSA